MPIAFVNGIDLSYDDVGEGEPVLLVMGTGSGGRVWHLHQVPDLVAHGYRAVTVDNRGIPPTDECADGISIDDLVGDVVALVEHLGIGPCALVGTSMGAHVVQEVALARPDLVRRCVLIATRGRTDATRAALARAERAAIDVDLPPGYRAVVRALQQLSPRTLADDAAVTDWLDLFEMNDPADLAGGRAQLGLDIMADRLGAYPGTTVPTHVIAFADDLVTPPGDGQDVASAIPGATFDLLDDCGHLGYLERPEAVNALLRKHLGRDRAREAA